MLKDVLEDIKSLTLDELCTLFEKLVEEINERKAKDRHGN